MNPGATHLARGIDRRRGLRAGQRPDGGDPACRDAEVGGSRRCAGSVDDPTISDQHVEGLRRRRLGQSWRGRDPATITLAVRSLCRANA